MNRTFSRALNSTIKALTALALFAAIFSQETRLLAADPTPLIPRKVLFDNPDKSQARISPDGKHLAFLAPVDGVLNVWVGPIDKPQDAKAITKDEKRGIRAYFW